MYSKRIIGNSISHWSDIPGNFTPEYHSVQDVDRVLQHLNSIHIFPPDGDLCNPIPKRALASMTMERAAKESWKNWLSPEEIKWIRNERALCKFDFWYWVSRYVYIKDEEDRPCRMLLWGSQDIFMQIVAEMQEQEIAIFLIILKARQLGISRIISLILLHMVLFRSDVNAFMASSTEKKTNKLFDMSDFVLSRLPFWMKPINYPQCKARQDGKFMELHNGSAITLEHGQQSTGIARGTTPTAAHISELAEFSNPKTLVDAALLRAMHPSVNSFLGLEGTAEGMNNWWHKKWLSAVSDWAQQRGRLRPLFLPWFVGGLYPKPVDLRMRPVPADYSSKIAPWAITHARAAAEYVHATEYLRNQLGSTWTMPIEQVWYYECERQTAINEDRLSEFLQEMPANADEAFQSKNISVFDTQTLTYYRDNAAATPLVGTYGLRCTSHSQIISERLQTSAMLQDPDRESIFVLCPCGAGYDLEFEFYPVKFNGWDYESDSKKGTIDKIFIFEMPIEGEVYGFGVDTADGIDKDRTVIEGIRKSSINGPTKQVVEFASSKMSAVDSWPFILAIATLYSVPDFNGVIHQPRVAIECRGHGDAVQNIIRMMGWSNFHPWNDKSVDSRRVDISKYHKIGVFTNEWFRSSMIDLLVKMLRDGEIEVGSPFLVNEMTSLENDPEKQSLRAGYGGHDDRIMALGFILISLFRWDTDYYRSAKVKAYSGQSPLTAGPINKQFARWAYSFQERNDSGIYEDPNRLLLTGKLQ